MHQTNVRTNHHSERSERGETPRCTPVVHDGSKRVTIKVEACLVAKFCAARLTTLDAKAPGARDRRCIRPTHYTPLEYSCVSPLGIPLTSFTSSCTASMDAPPDPNTPLTKNGTVMTPNKFVVTVKSNASASFPPACTIVYSIVRERRFGQRTGYMSIHELQQENQYTAVGGIQEHGDVLLLAMHQI